MAALLSPPPRWLAPYSCSYELGTHAVLLVHVCLGIDAWPKEARLGGGQSRSLKDPLDWTKPWEERNAALEDIGESPLLMSGFVSLRLCA